MCKQWFWATLQECEKKLDQVMVCESWKVSLHFLSSSFVIRVNLLHSWPSLFLLGFIVISLVFFCLSKLLFLGFLQLKNNFLHDQNDWTWLSLFLSQSCQTCYGPWCFSTVLNLLVCLVSWLALFCLRIGQVSVFYSSFSLLLNLTTSVIWHQVTEAELVELV